MADSDGARIYRRSLTFLLEAAFSVLFPNTNLYIDHSVATGGYYCHAKGRDSLSRDELTRLQTEMKRLVEADLPFTRQETPYDEAVAYFKKENYPDKVALLKHRRKPYVTLYQLGEHIDYHHGYMVPSTRYLKWFALLPTNGGFTPLPQSPRAHQLSPMEEYPKLLDTFRQYGNWLEPLGIDNVGALNDALLAGRGREVILVSEALHGQQVTTHRPPDRRTP